MLTPDAVNKIIAGLAASTLCPPAPVWCPTDEPTPGIDACTKCWTTYITKLADDPANIKEAQP